MKRLVILSVLLSVGMGTGVLTLYALYMAILLRDIPGASLIGLISSLLITHGRIGMEFLRQDQQKNPSQLVGTYLTLIPAILLFILVNQFKVLSVIGILLFALIHLTLYLRDYSKVIADQG